MVGRGILVAKEKMDRLRELTQEALPKLSEERRAQLRAYLEMRESASYEGIHPSSLKISTISSACAISKSRILDLEVLTALFEEKIAQGGSPIVRMTEKSMGNSIGIKVQSNEHEVNVGIFQNGKMTITGSSYDTEGLEVAEKVLAVIRERPECFYSVDPEDIEIEDYRITMINSGFEAGFKVDQMELYRVLTDNYPYFKHFNQEVYAGLVLHYMWQEASENNGICGCSESCLLRNTNNGDGKGDGDCRNISVCVFQSGQVIITGANQLEQLYSIYEDLNQIFRDHYPEIVSLSIADAST